eukprot:SAG22_NODE_5049_length_1101_cov_0.697605_2_plen_139_part_01
MAAAGFNIYPAAPELTEAQRQGGLVTGLPLCWGHENDAARTSIQPLATEDSGRTALYAAFLAGVAALYFETTHAGGGEGEYALALDRLLAHCELTAAVGAVVETVAPRLHHESLGHGAGLMSSHNQATAAGLWRPTKAV